MQGRQIEKAFRPALAALEMGLRCLPRFARRAVFSLFAGCPGYVGLGVRYACARALLAKAGRNIYIGRWCTIKNWERLEIGSNCSFHEYCYLDASGGITIGDDVSVAHGSSILSFDHSFDDNSRPIRDQPLTYSPVNIHADVWIGAGCRVLKGVTLASRTIVAANAVVNQDSSGYQIVGGVPARPIRELPK